MSDKEMLVHYASPQRHGKAFQMAQDLATAAAKFTSVKIVVMPYTDIAELAAARKVVEAARKFQIKAWDTHMFTDFGLIEALAAYDLARKGEK